MIHPFALHPLLYWTGGAAIIAVAWLGYQDDREAEASKQQALAQPQPEATRLEGFDPNIDIGHDGEVTILAQVDLDQVWRLERERGLPREARWAAPLYETTAKEPQHAVSGVLLASGGRPDAARLEPLIEKQGAFGPVLRLNGRLVEPGGFDPLIIGVLAEHGLVASPDAVYLDPFLDGRERAFGPDRRGRARAIALSLLGVLVILYGVLWGAIRRRFVLRR